MLDEETYKKEIVRMLDSLRKDHKGTETCAGVKCEKCPLDGFEYGCSNALSAFEMVEAVEKWSKEHPPKKYKLSRLEYEFLELLENEGYKYIVRSQINNLIAYKKMPIKLSNSWIAYKKVPTKLSNSWEITSEYKIISLFNTLFQFVKWEDIEPTLIKDVLNNCYEK